MNDFKNKIAVITGATAGIGKAIALKFAQKGAYIILIGRDESRGRALVHEIGENNCQFFSVDVSKTQQVKDLTKKILKDYSKVDFLINNAGITKDNLLLRLTEKEWDEVMEINVKSCYNFCQSLLLSMMKAGYGKIVNISSVVGITGNAGQTNYCASKAAVIGFTKALALEVAKRGICVNCVAPGFIMSQMTNILSDEQKENILSRIPLGRMGTAEEIAHAVAFLCSDESNYITGQVLTIDGGMVNY